MSRRAFSLATIAVLCGCAPTETGNPGGEHGVVVLRLSAYTSDPVAVAIGASEGGLGVTRASLQVDSVYVTSCDPTTGAEHVEVGRVVDLRAGGTVEIEAGEACGLSVVMASASDAGAPAFSVEGARADGVPVLLTSQVEAAVSVAPASGALALSEGSAPFFAFDLSAWLGGLGLDSVAPDATGSLVVDATTHPSLIDDAAAALTTSATLNFDANGDGLLSSAELHDVAASPP
jgi:hypothetical protein